MSPKIHACTSLVSIKFKSSCTVCVIKLIIVTKPEKAGLIYTKYTYSYYGAYLLYCVCYSNSVSFTEFLYIYEEICIRILSYQNELLNLKRLKFKSNFKHR